MMWREVKDDVSQWATRHGFTAYLDVAANGVEISVSARGASAKRVLPITPDVLCSPLTYGADLSVKFAALGLMEGAWRAREDLLAVKGAALAMEAV